jgi:hypothetical protein
MVNILQIGASRAGRVVDAAKARDVLADRAEAAQDRGGVLGAEALHGGSCVLLAEADILAGAEVTLCEKHTSEMERDERGNCS